MSNPFLSVIYTLLPEPQSSLLSGMLFGVKETMPKDLYQALVITSTLHVVALSGTNISILVDLTMKVTEFLGRKISSFLTIIFITFFVLFVGPSSTIIRAAIMGSLSMISIITGRKDWALLSLFLASGIMLLVHPDYLNEISFQLSFLATFGVILAQGVIKRQHTQGAVDQAVYFLKENLVLTVFAQVFTLPVIALQFQRVSLIGPVANLLVGWVVQPIMILGIITAVSGSIFHPLGMIAAWIVWVPLTYFVKVVEILAVLPFASISF